jgi:hypothetical protein
MSPITLSDPNPKKAAPKTAKVVAVKISRKAERSTLAGSAVPTPVAIPSPPPLAKPSPVSAAKKAPAPVTKPGKAVRSSLAATRKPAKSVKPETPVKIERPRKPKLVRDSFTIPKSEYELLAALKTRSVKLNQPMKKSELLRAGIALLTELSDDAFLAVTKKVPALKTGRPKTETKSPQ